MDAQFRLTFRGEVLDGQHVAVVKKRLQAVLELDDARMEKLFSGAPVVLRKAADEKTADRFREAFNKAGARLKVMPVAAPEEAPAPSPADEPSPEATPPPPAGEAPPASPGGLELTPPGTDVLAADERRVIESADVDVSHLSVAPPGSGLGSGDAAPADQPVIDAHFDLAEPGADLLDEHPSIAPALDLSEIDFGLAEAGADLGAAEKPAPPPAPDTSHLNLAE